jgi:hypothetical protein
MNGAQLIVLVVGGAGFLFLLGMLIWFFFGSSGKK